MIQEPQAKLMLSLRFTEPDQIGVVVAEETGKISRAHALSQGGHGRASIVDAK